MRILRTRAVVVLAVGLFLLASCASPDVSITTKVKARFAADDVVKASQIEVSSAQGVVTLKGNVDSEAAKTRALELARAVEGVVEVVDMISAREASGSGDAPDPERTAGEAVDDAGITMNVKRRLLEDPEVKGLQIDVDTRDGVVYLTGSVGSDVERQRAIQLAKDAKGVRDVQANLTVGGN